MFAYIARRLLSTIPVMVVVAVMVFAMLRLTPGDPASIIAGAAATSQDVAEIRIRLGLDRPIVTQFFIWLGHLLTGDFARNGVRTEFLKAGFDDLRQVAALVLFGNADGFFDLSFFEAAGNCGSKFTGLLARLAERDVAVDHHADGPCGHDRKQDDDTSGGKTHLSPHGAEVETNLALEHNCKHIELYEQHKPKVLLESCLSRLKFFGTLPLIIGRKQSSQ